MASYSDTSVLLASILSAVSTVSTWMFPFKLEVIAEPCSLSHVLEIAVAGVEPSGHSIAQQRSRGPRPARVLDSFPGRVVALRKHANGAVAVLCRPFKKLPFKHKLWS